MLLKEQGTLQTPVGVFAAQHESATIEPAQAQFYKQLIPLSRPQGSEQYAFNVELDRCTGCKGCVSACHSLNGLDEDETWRDVGTIQGSLEGVAYTQTVTTACHHCIAPACLNGCPVSAYEKDPTTGIVRHLDDQCIGCQYCSLKCPYDVPKYSKKHGIVRKCDMCQSRLAEGEAPACVQACPTEAISIVIVNTKSVEDAVFSSATFLPAAPNSKYTLPTTQFATKREIPANAEAGDHYVLRSEHAHLPLVVMLVLTQLSVGLYAFSLFQVDAAAHISRLIAFVSMCLGLVASTAHLGRPFGAWRAFLGLRSSWLSREIIIFGIFSIFAAAYTACSFFTLVPARLEMLIGVPTVGIGLFGVFCSVMIYHDTPRPFWDFPVSFGKFFGTTLGLAMAAHLAIFTVVSGLVVSTLSIVFVIGVFLLKMFFEAGQLRAANFSEMSSAKKSALLMLKPLRRLSIARYLMGLMGVLCLVAVLLGASAVLFLVSGFVLLLGGELLERVLFFKAASAPRMPGAFTS
jgi:Fe-S-cluster-containing dehydrogenase component/DMSO reductase anchor subunit